ncbi:hypothetical protein HG530_013231 [Fusarium avenaceum]|nr:hypothetical protein HG530_013231 [Fusarium avenaceum]
MIYYASSSIIARTSGSLRRIRFPSSSGGLPSRTAPKSRIYIKSVNVTLKGLLWLTYLDISDLVSLDSSHTSSFVKLDLPNTAEVTQQVLNTFAGLYIPHLDSLLAAADDLASVMLETGNGASVRHKRITTLAILWIPDTKGRVGRCRN